MSARVPRDCEAYTHLRDSVAKYCDGLKFKLCAAIKKQQQNCNIV